MPSHISTWIFKIVTPIFVLGIVGFALWSGIFQKHDAGTEQKTTASTTTSQNISQNSSTKDTDNDGLKDWEEILFKTDPYKADSDGDGTLDGAEIKEGRDPAKKAPNDYLTVDVVKDIAPQYNASVEAQNRQKTTAKTPNLTPTSPDTGLSQSEKLVLKTYGNSLGGIIKKRTQDYGDQEAEVFDSIVGKNGQKSPDFDGFNQIASSYSAVSGAVSQVSTPENVKDLQNALVQGYSNIANSLKMLASYKTTAKIPGNAYQEYNQSSISLGKAFVAISLYFKQNNISFAPNEPGAIFNLP